MSSENNRADVRNAATDKCPMNGNGEHPVSDQYGKTTNSGISAADPLNHQTWCWGQDIERPGGNWLLEIGFDRIEPPADRKDCSSVYSLTLPRGRCVVLRGFGVLYGDRQRGGVFLPRYELRPRYTTHATLGLPPWSDADLRKRAPRPTRNEPLARH